MSQRSIQAILLELINEADQDGYFGRAGSLRDILKELTTAMRENGIVVPMSNKEIKDEAYRKRCTRTRSN